MNNQRRAKLIVQKRDKLVDYINEIYSESFDRETEQVVIINERGLIYSISSDDDIASDEIKICSIKGKLDDPIPESLYMQYIEISGMKSRYEKYEKENELHSAFDFIIQSGAMADFDKWMRNKLTEEFINSNKALEMIKNAYLSYAFKQE